MKTSDEIAELRRHYNRFMAVVPGYQDLFGKAATIEELVRRLGMYDAEQWLSVLSRIQSVVVPGTRIDTGLQAQLAADLFSSRIKLALRDWEQRRGEKSQYTIYFFEHQIGVLQELAVIHGAPEGTGCFESDSSFDDFGTAILLVSELVHRTNFQNTGDVFAAGIQHQVRVQSLTHDSYFRRAVRFYQLDRAPTPRCVEYLERFEKASGIGAAEYIVGGMIVAKNEVEKPIKVHQRAWTPIPAGVELDNPIAAAAVANYLSVSSNELPTLKKSIERWERQPHPKDYHLIPLSLAPAIKIDKHFFSLNLTRVGRSLFEGIYFANLAAASQSDGDDGVKQVNGLFGGLLEHYVYEFLNEYLQSPVMKIDEAVSPGYADFVLPFPQCVMIADAKCSRFVQTKHYSLLSVEARRDEVRKIVEYGVTQVGRTIIGLASGKLPQIESKLPTNWRQLPFIPAVFAFEFLPCLLGVNDFLYGPFNKSLREAVASTGIQVEPLRLMALEDVEALPDISSPAVGRVLAEWAHHKHGRSLTFRQFLDIRKVQSIGCVEWVESAKAMRFLASSVGLSLPLNDRDVSIDLVRHRIASTLRNHRRNLRNRLKRK